MENNVRYTRARAIKLFCKVCCGGSYKEVAKCDNHNCYLYRYRTGKEQKDDLYKETKRSSNFSTINSKRKNAHLNDEKKINAV